MEEINLITIAKQLHDLELKLIETHGELSCELESEFSVAQIQKQKKIDSYYAVLERCKRIESEYESKAEMYLRVAKNASKLGLALKNNLKEAMSIMNCKELEGEQFKFKLVDANKNKLEILDKDLIPFTFFKEVLVLELDKEKLEAALLKGEDIQGAKFVAIKSLRSSVK